MGIRNSPNDLVKACLDLLRVRGICATRINGAALKIGGRFVRCTDCNGVSDVLAVVPRRCACGVVWGQFAAIECKTGSGRLSADQEAFLANVRAGHGLGVVVHSVADLERVLKLEGVLVNGA